MLADALTKGKVARDALLYSLWHAEWSIQQKVKVQHFPTVRPNRHLYFPAAELRDAPHLGHHPSDRPGTRAEEQRVGLNLGYKLRQVQPKQVGVRRRAA